MAKQPKETWANGREYKGIVQCKKYLSLQSKGQWLYQSLTFL